MSLLLALAACGGDEERTLPDESGDLAIGSGGSSPSHLAGTRPVGPEVGGTRWRFVEASCTEGAPELAGEGFDRFAEVLATDAGLLFLYDQRFGDACTETVAQVATPGDTPDSEWQMVEEARVSVGDCPTQPEENRPGDVRMRGQFLEVWVQRSNWCNGLEVKHVYAPARPAAPDGPQLARHYALHFNRQDARRVTELFSASGSLVEPFNRTPEDQPMRHDGQAAIYQWYQEAFGNTPWLAMKVTGLEPGVADGAWVMTWHYMDPRLDVPFGGRNLFTVAGGEIFEATIEITQQQVPVEGLEEAAETIAPEATGEVSAPAEEAAEGEAAAGEEGAAEGEAEEAAEDVPPPPADPEAG
ncbi:MAG: hypothetical protein CMN31_26565 [Sandaracinus sp.]|nr:hypothetical protein [Sandaracinus sp.]